MVLPELGKRVDVTAFGSLDGYDAGAFDAAIYQLGNNPHHAFVYAEAMRRPGVVVLHDLVLHHLIVEMTLARGQADDYVAALGENHGAAGEAWARGRVAGLHSEMGNFLLPASVEVARRSLAVIVHNRWAADRLRSLGAGTPIVIAPHPFEAAPESVDRDAVRASLGIGESERAIGLFGFLTSAKRAEVVVEAFRRARERDRRLRLLIVGEPAPNIDMTSIAGEGVIVTGYVDDADFARYYAAADRLVNLRYPSAGETSGTLIRAFAAGKPVAVSDYAQFAEYPDSCAVRIAFGTGEVDALARFFLEDIDEESVARAQRAWLDEHARVATTVDRYLEALEIAAAPRQAGSLAPRRGGIPMFPRLSLAGVAFSPGAAILTLRNDGDATVEARVYGQPAYRALVKLFDQGREVADHWLQLDRDLPPGALGELRVPVPGEGALTLRLFHALEGIPLVEAQLAAEVEIGRV